MLLYCIFLLKMDQETILFKYDNINLFYDNTGFNVGEPVEEIIEILRWDVLFYSPYSPNMTPSNY